MDSTPPSLARVVPAHGARRPCGVFVRRRAPSVVVPRRAPSTVVPRRAVGILALALLGACVGRPAPLPPRPAPLPAPQPAPSAPATPPVAQPEPLPADLPPAPDFPAEEAGPLVRIALATASDRPRISATGAWRLYDADGESTVLYAQPGDEWAIEQQGGWLRAVRDDGETSARRPGPLIARTAEPGALLIYGGRRYRGELVLSGADGGVLVVNRLPVEDYLRGVVPLEIGPRTAQERAAVEAQAVAARSYAYTHRSAPAGRPYDMLPTVMDQVYGGADAETPLTDAAVRGTAGLVLTYEGRVVNAPYHSTCGPSTAAVSEVWTRSGDEPYLRAVSDRIPGTEHYYGEASPRFTWTRTLDAGTLSRNLERYLRSYADVPPGGPGRATAVEVSGLTPSGRVASLVIRTTRGRYVLRGNDIRFVMRSAGGEILNSTYFSVDAERDTGGRIERITFRGMGYGHGIGMCQWGAIGRARAGQSFRAILDTYYPGTTVAPVE